jgi:type II secretory pathway pseudopilin PulG
MPKFKSTSAGFGLIELMVSIGIVVLVMAIVMVNHNKSTSAVLLRSQAYEIALDAREVQLSAVSAIGLAGDFRNVIGLYFNTSTNRDYYLRFAETGTNNFFYNSGEELSPRGALDPRFEIDAIRLMDGTTVSAQPSAISVVFERPNFDALFYTAANSPADPNVSAVEIDVRLVGTTGTDVGAVRTVEITRTGQISVQ